MSRRQSVVNILIVVFTLLNAIQVSAQNTSDIEQLKVIIPYHLTIGFNKTSNIVFPFSIKSVDRGSSDVLIQKAKAVNNILQVKAARPNFPETNLSVITGEGKLYAFIVNYAAEPTRLNVRFEGDFFPGNTDTSQSANNEKTLLSDALKINNQRDMFHGIKAKSYKIKMELNGLFIHNDVMYFRLKLENKSNLDYDIDMLHLSIRDKERAKRTAVQETTISPLSVFGNTTKIKAKSFQDIIIAVSKFTIPNKKYLVIQMMERGGGRHLFIKVKNRIIIKAHVLLHQSID